MLTAPGSAVATGALRWVVTGDGSAMAKPAGIDIGPATARIPL